MWELRAAGGVRLLFVYTVVSLLCALPSSAAHPGDEYETFTATDGDVMAYLSPQTLALKASQEAVLVVQLYGNRTYEEIPNATLVVTVAKGQTVAQTEWAAYGAAYGINVTFPSPGGWNVTIRVVEPANASGSFRFPLVVYPDSAYRVDATDARYRLFYTGGESRTSFLFLDDTTGDAVRQDFTASVRIERVDDAGSVIDTAEVALARGGSSSQQVLKHQFLANGTYLLRFASPELGLTYAHLPPAKIGVTAGDDPDAPRSTPGFGMATLLTATLAVLWAVKRRRAP